MTSPGPFTGRRGSVILGRMTSTCPVSFQLSLRPRVAHGADHLRISAYGAVQGRYGSQWGRELDLPTTVMDTPIARLRAAAMAILEATGGLTDGEIRDINNENKPRGTENSPERSEGHPGP